MFKALQLMIILPCLLQQWCSGRDEESSQLVQLNDCTCQGYNQTFECRVFGGGFTIWQGTALSGCQQFDDEIQLRHSQYVNSQAVGQCIDGTTMAKSVGVSGNCYVSQLSLAVREEMINETIECIYRDLQLGVRTIIGRRMLNFTLDVSYPPPTNIRFENTKKNQIVFTWDEMNDTMCSSILYVITAINCGICPNTTANTNITCIYTQSKASVGNNYNNSVVTCMLAVQTEICGYLRGEKSEYITVHIDELQTTIEEDKSATLTTLSTPSLEMVNTSTNILVPLLSSVLSIAVILLLLVVVGLSVFMSKQIMNLKTATTEECVQNNQEGIYSMLQPLDANIDCHNATLDSNHKDVVYASVGTNPDEQDLRCETMLQFKDDKVEYSEIKCVDHESIIRPMKAPLDLNNLLLQFCTESLAPKWYQLGIAVGVSEEMLDQCSNRPPEEAVTDVLGYWMKNYYKPSWEDFIEVLKEIGLDELASKLLINKGMLQRQIKDDDKVELEFAAGNP